MKKLNMSTNQVWGIKGYQGELKLYLYCKYYRNKRNLSYYYDTTILHLTTI